MTDNQKRVLLGLIDGKTYAEIGREMGITRQAAHAYAKSAVMVREIKNRQFYPNLCEWIAGNCRSVRAFAKHYDLSEATISLMLRQGRNPSWRTIKRLCDITGMSAEELMVKGNEDIPESIQEND